MPSLGRFVPNFGCYLSRRIKKQNDAALDVHTGIHIIVDKFVQSEISYFVGSPGLPFVEVCKYKMDDGTTLACIIFGFLVRIPCARLNCKVDNPQAQLLCGRFFSLLLL